MSKNGTIGLVPHCYTNIVSGLLICVANGFAGLFFSVLMKNWRKYVLFSMLCGAEMINGLQYLVIGIGRLILIDRNLMNTSISSWDCLLYRPWMILSLLGGQLPAALHTCLALERILAVFWSYHHTKMGHFRVKLWLAAISGVLVGAGTLTGVLLILCTPPVISPDKQCKLRIIGSGWYGTAQFTVVAIIYVVDLVVMAWVLVVIDKRTNTSRHERRRHVIVTLMSLVSVLAISLPSFSTFLYHFGVVIGETLTVIIYTAPAIPPTLNPLLYFLCLPSYRHKLRDLFCRPATKQSILPHDVILNIAANVDAASSSKSGSETRF